MKNWIKKLINPNKQIRLELPRDFNEVTMLEFIDNVTNKQKHNQSKKLYFNFSTLVHIEPIGIVVLSNLIDFFDKIKVDIVFEGFDKHTEGNFLLDQAGFFKHHLGDKYLLKQKYKFKKIESNKKHFRYKLLELVSSENATQYLYFNLMPWIEREIGLYEDSLSTLRSSIEEIFHNIRDHSGVKKGYVFVQYAKNRNEIQIIISDFGIGIPSLVKTKLPALNLDSDALRKACEEGFTTQSNVRNRGAGLPNLMRYITLRDGTVLIISGKAKIIANKNKIKNKASASHPIIKTKKHNVAYPGTLVNVVLRTNTLKQFAEDIKEEIFEW